MKIFQSSKNKEQGFTIVELMIALSVFSVIMLIGTLVMMQIGKLYTKGVNQASLQNATRNVLLDVSSAVQFSSDGSLIEETTNATLPGIRAVCIGKLRYTYILDRKLGTDNFPTRTNPDDAPITTAHVMWRDQMSSSGGCTPLDIRQTNPPGSSNGYEMMPVNTRLTEFSVDRRATGGVEIKVYAAYGDGDLAKIVGGASRGQPFCEGGQGTQFCAISILDTIVTPRL